jgi:hypothetical protein
MKTHTAATAATAAQDGYWCRCITPHQHPLKQVASTGGRQTESPLAVLSPLGVSRSKTVEYNEQAQDV